MDASMSSDRSVNGLVVFLTLSVFLAVLTSGLIVCLLKIWLTGKTGYPFKYSYTLSTSNLDYLNASISATTNISRCLFKVRE
uniref:Ovule protein n=1 Tax=Angiostrongylus cantonensis TaxID=6313 RepID=A0A0K0DQG4_ANGCA